MILHSLVCTLICLPQSAFVGVALCRSAPVNLAFFQRLCNVNALFRKASAFVIKSYQTQRLIGGGLQVICLLRTDSVVGESEALTFTPCSEVSLNSKNACDIYLTLRFPMFVYFYTGYKVQLITTGHWNRM